MCDRRSTTTLSAISDLERKKIFHLEILWTVGRKVPDSTWALFKQYQSLYLVEKGHDAFTVIICKYMVQMWSEWNSLREYIYHITRTLFGSLKIVAFFSTRKSEGQPKVHLKGVLILQLASKRLLNILTMLLGRFRYLDRSCWARISFKPYVFLFYFFLIYDLRQRSWS